MIKIAILGSILTWSALSHSQTPVTGAQAPAASANPNVVMPAAMPAGVAVDNPGVVAAPGTAPAGVAPDNAAALQQQMMMMQMMQNQNKGQGKKQQPQIPQGLGSMLQGLGGGGGAGQGASGAGRGGGSTGADSGSGGGVAQDNCPGAQPDPVALKTMLDCTKGLSQATNRLASLVDIDKKVMFIIDRNGPGNVVKCVPISTGRNGAGSEYGQTPTGCLVTIPHHGDYDSSASGTQKDCIGLQGTDSDTKRRENAGVIMHKAHGGAGSTSTLGCIGVKDDEFDQIKDMLYGSDGSQKHSVVCAFTAQTRGECKIGRGSSGGTSETASGTTSTTGSSGTSGTSK